MPLQAYDPRDEEWGCASDLPGVTRRRPPEAHERHGRVSIAGCQFEL
jgi:hypothetical protein